MAFQQTPFLIGDEGIGSLRMPLTTETDSCLKIQDPTRQRKAAEKEEFSRSAQAINVGARLKGLIAVIVAYLGWSNSRTIIRLAW